MAKLQLKPNETIIGSGQVALHKKQFLNTKAFDGNIYITNQRACFQVRMIGTMDMDLPLAEIKGFSVGKKALFTAVTIHSKAGESYVFTGFPIKKLQEWLREVGVQEI